MSFPRAAHSLPLAACCRSPSTLFATEDNLDGPVVAWSTDNVEGHAGAGGLRRNGGDQGVGTADWLTVDSRHEVTAR